MSSRFLFVSLLFSLLTLSACGEGWERKILNDITPYGNERTAGSIVAYVRASMMPEKTVKVDEAVLMVNEVKSSPEPVEEMREEAVPMPELLKQVVGEMESLFGAAQRK